MTLVELQYVTGSEGKCACAVLVLVVVELDAATVTEP